MPAYINGQQVNGCTNYASAVTCVDKDGNKSTVQAEMDELNKKFAIYTEELSKRAVYGGGNLTNVVIPFDVSDKQIISVDLVSTGWVGVVNQALYYSKANGGIVLSAYSTHTQNIEADATVVVRYLLK